MSMIHPPWWDSHSDQPFKLGQSQKPRFQGANLNEYLRTGLSAVALSPIIAWRYAGSVAVKPPPLTDFVGLGISPDYASHNTMRVFYIIKLSVLILCLGCPKSFDDIQRQV